MPPIKDKKSLIIEIKGSVPWLRRLEIGLASMPLFQRCMPYIRKGSSTLTLEFHASQDAWDDLLASFEDSVRRLEAEHGPIEDEIAFEIRSGKSLECDPRPLYLGNQLTILPANRDKAPPTVSDSGRTVVLETGWAFGTGRHPTTRLCLDGLLLLRNKGMLFNKKVLDIGTGTGILAITAVMLGCTSAAGVDISNEALEIANANIKRNRLEERISLFSNLDEVVDSGPFDIIVANLTPSVISRIVSSMITLSRDDTIFLLSGFGPQHVSDLIELLGRFGVDQIMSRMTMQGWALLMVTKRIICDNFEK